MSIINPLVAQTARMMNKMEFAQVSDIVLAVAFYIHSLNGQDTGEIIRVLYGEAERYAKETAKV